MKFSSEPEVATEQECRYGRPAASEGRDNEGHRALRRRVREQRRLDLHTGCDGRTNCQETQPGDCEAHQHKVTADDIEPLISPVSSQIQSDHPKEPSKSNEPSTDDRARDYLTKYAVEDCEDVSVQVGSANTVASGRANSTRSSRYQRSTLLRPSEGSLAGKMAERAHIPPSISSLTTSSNSWQFSFLGATHSWQEIRIPVRLRREDAVDLLAFRQNYLEDKRNVQGEVALPRLLESILAENIKKFGLTPGNVSLLARPSASFALQTPEGSHKEAHIPDSFHCGATTGSTSADLHATLPVVAADEDEERQRDVSIISAEKLPKPAALGREWERRRSHEQPVRSTTERDQEGHLSISGYHGWSNSPRPRCMPFTTNPEGNTCNPYGSFPTNRPFPSTPWKRSPIALRPGGRNERYEDLEAPESSAEYAAWLFEREAPKIGWFRAVNFPQHPATVISIEYALSEYGLEDVHKIPVAFLQQKLETPGCLLCWSCGERSKVSSMSVEYEITAATVVRTECMDCPVCGGLPTYLYLHIYLASDLACRAVRQAYAQASAQDSSIRQNASAGRPPDDDTPFQFCGPTMTKMSPDQAVRSSAEDEALFEEGSLHPLDFPQHFALLHPLHHLSTKEPHISTSPEIQRGSTISRDPWNPSLNAAQSSLWFPSPTGNATAADQTGWQLQSTQHYAQYDAPDLTNPAMPLAYKQPTCHADSSVNSSAAEHAAYGMLPYAVKQQPIMGRPGYVRSLYSSSDGLVLCGLVPPEYLQHCQLPPK